MKVLPLLSTAVSLGHLSGGVSVAVGLEGGLKALEVVEVRVFQSLHGGDALSGFVDQHLFQQVESVGVQVRAEFGEGLLGPLGEGLLEITVGTDSGPHILGRGTQASEDAEKLVDLAITREKRNAGNHLAEDAADGPDIHSSGVLLATEKDLRCTVPQGNNL